MYIKECIKEIERVGGRQGRLDFLRLDMNENPEGLPKEITEAIKAELTPEFFATYPEPERFLTVLADYLDVKRKICALRTVPIWQSATFLKYLGVPVPPF